MYVIVERIKHHVADKYLYSSNDNYDFSWVSEDFFSELEKQQPDEYKKYDLKKKSSKYNI